MNNIIFDTGPLISLATNNLLWILKGLKTHLNGEFYMTPAVKREAVTRPLETKKFKLEAIQLLKNINEGVIKELDMPNADEVLKMLDVANNIFFAHDNPIKIVHYAEMEVLMSALTYNANTIIIDERTTRLLVDDPMRIKKRLEKKLHTKIDVDKDNLDIIKKKFKGLNMLRSVELTVVAFELGIIDEYLVKGVKNIKHELLEGLLWGLKLKGCSIREEEIDTILKYEKLN